jgi:hypothetical protein
MMLRKIALYAALMIAIPAAAEAREVATEAQPQARELAVANPDMRSFFEPKTKSDVNALATLEKDLMASLNQELSH